MPPYLEDDDKGGDTIIVKGEYRNGSRPSSSPSMSPGPELEPLVANLLAQINPPRDLESPEPLEDVPARAKRPAPGSSGNTSNERPRGNTTMEDRLQSMPEKRAMPWREGVEPGADTETGGDSRRKQIRFGCLLATRGDVQDPPCQTCANGRGKFSVCIALEGYFKGACASCQLSGRPNRCSIKVNDAVTESPATDHPSADVSFNSPQQPTLTAARLSTGAPPAKRKRMTKVAEKRLPALDAARPQWQQELGAQAQQQVNELAQRPWATVNKPVSTPPSNSNGNNASERAPRTIHNQPISVGWATVNQPQQQPSPALVPRPTYSGGEGNESSSRRNTEQERRESTIFNEEGSVALIDTLPKNKQRQVYGLMSGIQGGIEHLQRELDSLKRAFGIDEEV